MPGPNLEAFQRALTSERLRQMQIVHVAIAGAPLAFAVVVVVMALRPNETPEIVGDAFDLARTLSVVHAAFFAGTFPLALLLPRSVAARGIAHAESGEDEPEAEALCVLGVLRTAFLVRIALLEGVALFGLIVLLLAGTKGILAEHPLLWLNAGSTLVLFVIAALTLPTHERIVGFYRSVAGV